MTPPTSRSQVSRQQITAFFLGLFTVLLGVMVVVGWAIQSDALKTVFPGLVTMKVNTALGLALCGGAVAFLATPGAVRPARLAAGFMATTAVAIGALTLCQYFFHWNLEIDEMFFRDLAPSVGTSAPGRMAPSTAFCFALTGSALVVASLRLRPALRFPFLAGVGTTLLVIGGAGMVGQLVNAGFNREFWNFTGMAVHTAGGFVMIGAGLVLLVRNDNGIAWALNSTSTLGFALAVAIMLCVAGLSWSYIYALQQAGTWVAHSNEILRTIENIRSEMSMLESGQRGYVITGDENLLADREKLRGAVQVNLNAMRQTVASGSVSKGEIDQLAGLIADRTQFGEQTILARREQGFPTAQKLLATGTGTQLTSEINRVIDGMRDDEYALLLDREREVDARATTAFLFLPSGIFLSLAILSIALFFLNAGLAEEKATRDKLKASLREVGDLTNALDEHAIVAITDPRGRITLVNDKFCEISKYTRGELLGQDHRIINSAHHSKAFIRELWTTISGGKVWRGEIRNRAKDGTFYWVDTTIVPFLDDDGQPRQYVAIRADITARKQAEEEVRLLNAELEQRVADRTAQLQAANKELEAFSYSVSHDLRAPLRAVDGFSQAVLEDFGPQLPEQGHRYLQTIRESAQRMGRLIDDLLAFSRLSRAPLQRQEIDTNRLVGDVLADLQPMQKGRQVDLRLRRLPPCYGDPALLKQVWVNLLSNALKYTSSHPKATIEIGARDEQGETVYFVQDDGAGFDMRYANKLFGVFQRLHRLDEFDGTGVGLAIVHRVIHRHGGRIWADAKPEQGATFSFTLNPGNTA